MGGNMPRYEVVSDLPEWTVWDNLQKRDLFPTKSGNRDQSCRLCGSEDALLIATALNEYAGKMEVKNGAE